MGETVDFRTLCCTPYPGSIEPAVAAGMVERELAVEGGIVHYWVTSSPDPARPWMVFLPGLSLEAQNALPIFGESHRSQIDLGMRIDDIDKLFSDERPFVRPR